ncbi:hypothetical protein ACFUT3_27190 [Streptomyces cinereoruber]|uniref:hypothetical protein n=1 Tax=Streptomyces cinereoruber TaxID=67260 RepID=UPI0036382862
MAHPAEIPVFTPGDIAGAAQRCRMDTIRDVPDGRRAVVGFGRLLSTEAHLATWTTGQADITATLCRRRPWGGVAE